LGVVLLSFVYQDVGASVGAVEQAAAMQILLQLAVLGGMLCMAADASLRHTQWMCAVFMHGFQRISLFCMLE
jgi:hypothetical protein